MKIIKKLNPGQPGTKKYVEKFGKKLVCVRYRYDCERKRKVKTNHIIAEDMPVKKNSGRIPMNKIMNIQINYGEVHLGRIVKAAGGKWNRENKTWELAYQDVLELGLSERIIKQDD